MIISHILVFLLFLKTGTFFVSKLPMPLEISRENNTTDNPYTGCPRKMAMVCNWEISIIMKAKPIAVKKVIPHDKACLSKLCFRLVRYSGSKIAIILKIATITKQANNNWTAPMFSLVLNFLT